MAEDTVILPVGEAVLLKKLVVIRDELRRCRSLVPMIVCAGAVPREELVAIRDGFRRGVSRLRDARDRVLAGAGGAEVEAALKIAADHLNDVRSRVGGALLRFS